MQLVGMYKTTFNGRCGMLAALGECKSCARACSSSAYLHLHSDVDTANHAAFGPIVEAHKVGGAGRQQRASVDALGCKVGADAFLLLEVLESLDARC